MAVETLHRVFYLTNWNMRSVETNMQKTMLLHFHFFNTNFNLLFFALVFFFRFAFPLL